MFLIGKEKFFNALGGEAVSFSTWMVSTADPDAEVVKFMFDSMPNIDLDSSLVIDTILPMLVLKGVILQTTANAILALKPS